MVETNYTEFDKVYNKLINILYTKIRDIHTLRSIGFRVDYNHVKLLNMYIRYLDNVKESKYTYFSVNGLTNISNYLNKL